ncbi:hypothetical protein ERJ75_001010400 [Trypanosoma vivax]|uniref:Putative immunodominant antigen n=1 Tax=Trypanosoma vivax (strain Y486) TaxID=1055687 RepID=G0TYL6_TRYVY|nr:hypothetical protein ERJ75_001010400 [Trypanosoma vivax]CCC49063.1 putative immunodominant antigen [Trypanosoma vivax Y486]
MTVTVDLFGLAKRESKEGSVWAADAAQFDEIPEAPRVFADSQCYITYTMKKRNALRVLQRSNLSKVSMRVHTTPIHMVRFVNYRSNVAASASENEFFVWHVVEVNAHDGIGGKADNTKLAINVYFKLSDQVTIPSFQFFINAENKRPDLLVLYDRQAAILDSSALIASYDGATLNATLKRDSTTLRALTRTVSEESLCSVGSGGWFAFTTGHGCVAACTLQHRSTPAWTCCEGEPVESLHLLDTPHIEGMTILLAGCSHTVYQWVLSGAAEPTLQRKFTANGTIVSLGGSRDTFALFDDKKQLAVVTLQTHEKFLCTHYVLPCQVRRGGVCFNSVGESGYFLVDKEDRLTLMHVKPADSTTGMTQRSNAGVLASAPANDVPSDGTPSNSKKLLTSVRQSPGTSIIASLVNQLGLHGVTSVEKPSESTSNPLRVSQHGESYGQGSRPATAALSVAKEEASNTTTATSLAQGAPLVSATSTGMAQRTTTEHAHASFTYPSNHGIIGTSSTATTRPALQNFSLPQAPTDGILAAAVHQAEEDVRQQLERLESVMTNTEQILKLAPETIRRAHQQLLDLSLEAQMTELQKQQQKDASSPTCSVFTAFEKSVLMSLLDPLTHNIAKGISQGVEEAVMVRLDYDVRNVLVNRTRSTQKQAVKTYLEDAVKESTSQFLAQTEQTIKNVVKGELADVFGHINSLLTTLTNENNRLRGEVDAIMGSGILKDLRNTREELRSLRETMSSQRATGVGQYGVSSFHGYQSPETILSTALSYVNNQEYHRGLEYVLLARQPTLLLQFFKTLQGAHEQLYSAIIEDNTISNETWCQVFICISEAPSTDEERRVVATVLADVLFEHEQLLQKARHDTKVTEILRSFVCNATAEVKNKSTIRMLKDLEKLLQ